jgi:ATP-dependent Clp protease ATP-binding subunit ClpA
MKKHRASLEKDRTEKVDLQLPESSKETSSPDQTTLKSKNTAMAELNAILQKQKKDLEAMNEEIRQKDKLAGIDADLDQLNAGLEKDYGSAAKRQEQQPDVVSTFDDRAVFGDIEKEMKDQIIGQDEAIHGLCSALRRPYVMKNDKGKAKNVILILGPSGCGRHASLALAARLMKEKKIIPSDEVTTIDLSRYTSGAQEPIFLQDLYQALQGKGSFVCFENFSEGFPSFLRMTASLATDGRVVLSRRYVFTKGVLVENQTGLVKNSVDSLTASDKYLIFVTDDGIGSVQDAFGADFLYHVLDTITFKALDEAAMKRIISLEMEKLKATAKEKLGLDVRVDEQVNDWVFRHYDKGDGVDAVNVICHDFYVSLTDIRMNHEIDHVDLKVEEDQPRAFYDGGKNDLVRMKSSRQEIDAVNAELDQIVGLTQVKNYIRSLQAHMQIQQKRKEQGLKSAEISRHMIFTGNPGTGKTTIARLLSRYMKAIGALSQGQLVEVTRADLVAQYVGQTAPLTMSVIKSALGGVLFIDEAYSLYRGKDDSFGLEAIDTLVKAMEDHRDDLIVILAGYKKEMSVFLEANSGLKSRFPNIIYFPDYTGEELVKIAVLQAKGKGYVIAEDVLPDLQTYFDKVQIERAAEAGNGRLARNVIEAAILKQAERLIREPDARIDELKKEDFVLKL